MCVRVGPGGGINILNLTQRARAGTLGHTTVTRTPGGEAGPSPALGHSWGGNH